MPSEPSPTDHIRYDLLVRDALRGVVRHVLTDISRNGLPGDHHFYISFDTRAEGVRMSPRLKAQYPEEMTIVLQHQFWDLTVTELAFEAGMSFGGVAEKLYVPFSALRGFADPSVKFGLEFQVDDPAEPAADAQAAPAAQPQKPAKRTGRPGAATQDSEKAATPVAEFKPPKEPEPDRPSGGAEVVPLDRFRKK